MWLKRKEAEIFQTRILAQGVVDLSEKGADKTAEVFKQYTQALLPFISKEQGKKDQELKAVMEREVKKGMITFNAPQANPLAQRARAISMPDEVRRKLLEAKERREKGKRIVEI